MFSITLSFLAIVLLGLSTAQRSQYKNVVIVGAGIAGVAAAEELEKKGIKNYVILEAENYVGGRVHGVSMGGVKLPLGAGWIHHVGPYQPMWTMSLKERLKVHHDNYDDVIVRDAKTGKVYSEWKEVRANFTHYIDKVDELTSNRMKRGLSDSSLRAALTSAGWKAITPLQKTIEYFMIDFENGVPSDMMSARAYGITGAGKDAIVTDPRGFEHLINVMARPFRHKIKLGQVVTKISYGGHLARVHTKDGSVYQTDNVLVTVSSGVINSDFIKFEPSLPQWAKTSFSFVPMCSYCKVFMRFPKRFWENTNYILLAHEAPGEYIHFQNFDRPTLAPNKHILLATVTHKDCQRLETRSDKEVVDEIMATLKRIYGPSIPRPIEVLRNYWETNPHFAGAYSAPVSGIDNRDFESMKAPLNNKVWFAGEAVTNGNDFGYVQGAYVSGQLQAKALYNCWKRGRCKKPPVEPQMACIAKVL